jgi:hypothetical protein
MSLKRLNKPCISDGVVQPIQICYASLDEVRAGASSQKTGSVYFPFGEPVFVLDAFEEVVYERPSTSYTMVGGKKVWSTANIISRVVMARVLTQRGVVWVDPTSLHDFSD